MALPDPTTISGPVGDRLAIPTPQGTPGQSTHPSLVYLDVPVSGYRYWMAMTPYAGGDDEYEDPCVLASTDGITWVSPSSAAFPLDDQPGSPGAYNSDVDLRYVSGVFFLVWRTFDPAAVGAEEKLYFSSSADGLAWEPKTQIYSSDMTVRRLLSPCILFEGGAWTMWAVDIVPSPNQVVRLQGGAALSDAWADPVGVSMGPMLPGKEPWHLNLIPVDGGYVGLLTDCTLNVSGLDGLLLFVTSADGLIWHNSGQTVIPQSQPGEHNALYRATLVPETVNGVVGWRVWYSAWLTGSPSVWNIFRTFIAGPAAPDPTPTPLPPSSPAVIQQIVTWLGVNDRTGRVIAELPDMNGDPSRLLTAYDSARLTYPLADAPSGVPFELLMQATEPRATSIVAVANEVPVWAGRVLDRVGGSDPNLTLACATPEAAFKNMQVGSQSFTGVDRATVAQQLVANAVVVGGGSHMELEFDVAATGDPIDRNYLASDLTNVYDALRALAAGGLLEWTVDLRWSSTAQNQVARVLRIAPRIGRSGTSTTPLFDSAGSVLGYTMDENFSTERYANAVTVYGDGEGEDLPVSETVYDPVALSSGVPIVHRAIHVNDVTEVHELTAIARAELANLQGGAILWTIDSAYNAYPRLGYDAGLGDDIDWDVTGPRHPNGVTGRGRMIGWALNIKAARWSPKILEPGAEA